MGSHLDTPQWGAFELRMLQRREQRLRRRARRRRLVAVGVVILLAAAAVAALRWIHTLQPQTEETIQAAVTVAPLPARPVAPANMDTASLPAGDANHDVSRAEVQLPPPEPDPPQPAPARSPSLLTPAVDPSPPSTGTTGDLPPVATEPSIRILPAQERLSLAASAFGPAGLEAPRPGAPEALRTSSLPAEASPSPPPPPAPSPDPPPASPSPVVPAGFDANEVRRAIDRYRDAYQRLDADAARAIWPSVDAGALRRAFRDLASQRVDFDGCLVSGVADIAHATCTGRATFVPKVGDGAVTSAREWRFRLRRSRGGWVIDSAEVRN